MTSTRRATGLLLTGSCRFTNDTFAHPLAYQGEACRRCPGANRSERLKLSDRETHRVGLRGVAGRPPGSLAQCRRWFRALLGLGDSVRILRLAGQADAVRGWDTPDRRASFVESVCDLPDSEAIDGRIRPDRARAPSLHDFCWRPGGRSPRNHASTVTQQVDYGR